MSTVYRDILGRPWSVEKLDAMLADSDVLEIISFGVSAGLRRDRTWHLPSVLAWARTRFRREDIAAFADLLVTQFFHTKGAHYLGRRSVR